MTDAPLSSLFDLLPIGAFRTTPAGVQLQANAVLVRLNGCDTEAEMLAAGCDRGQGCLFARPMSTAAFDTWGNDVDSKLLFI